MFGTMSRAFSLVVCLASLVAFGGGKELPLDEDWSQIPKDADTTAVTPVPEPAEKEKALRPAQLEAKKMTPAVTGLSAPPIGLVPSANSGTSTPAVVTPVTPPAPESWNDVSLYGARTLSPGTFAVGGYAGFPTFNVRARYGVIEGFDVGLGFESFYGMMNEAQLQVRYMVARGDTEFSVAADGSYAQFVLKPQADPVGARWITGHRNWNVAPGIILSRRASAPTLPRLFLDARVLLAFDTQPYQRNPLGGVPQGVQMAWNVPVRMGGEIPITPKSSFVVNLGFDIHGRSGDSVFMPVLSVGAAVGL